MVNRITSYLVRSGFAAHRYRRDRRRLPVLAAAGMLGGCLALSACQSSSTDVLGPSGSKCSISVPSSLPEIGPDGGTGTLTITLGAECPWSVSSGADWIAITSNTSGQGGVEITYIAAANPTAAVRRGAVIVSNRRVAVLQTGARCQFTLTPESAVVGPDGGEGVISVGAVEGCAWSASSDAEWLSIVSAQSGVGAGTVRFRGAANAGPARMSSLTIGGRRVAVHQGAAGLSCQLAIGRTEQTVPASGGTDLVTVTGAGGCPWVAESHAEWITVTSGATGIGDGTVALSVAPNTGPSRLGVVTIAGHTYFLTQPAAATGSCSIALSSSGQSITAAGGPAVIGVTAANGCSWTATTATPWISIASGGSGTGNGTVVLNVGVNTGVQRTGTVTIAGKVHTITQAATVVPTCSYTLDEPAAFVQPLGGITDIGVETDPGCRWAATSHAPWITVVSGTGTGSGVARLLVLANTGPERVDTVTIAGRTFTVTQSALLLIGCSYSWESSGTWVPATATEPELEVMSAHGCNWTAAS